MDQRTLQMIQRGLIAAVSIVLALILISAFRGLLQPPGLTIPPSTTTTLAGEGTGAETTTTSTVATTVASSTSTTVGTGDAVCVEEPPPSDAATLLQIYFPCGSQDLAVGGTYVYRTVPTTDLVLTATLKEMVKGIDSDEQSLGFRSPFPGDADGSSLGVTIDADQTAYVEFSNRVFPDGVDTPEGAQIFITTLNANVFQFDTIQAVEYRTGGSCDAFWQHLGDKCQKITRAQWEAQLSP